MDLSSKPYEETMLALADVTQELRGEVKRAKMELKSLDIAIKAIESLARDQRLSRDGSSQVPPPNGRVFSAAARRRISMAQKVRWANYRKQKKAERH